MNRTIIAAVLTASCASIAGAQGAETLPYGREVEVNGIEVACAGIGDEARTDPRWKDYALRIEFANRDAQYLSDVEVALRSAEGEELLNVRCNSPWLLADVPQGQYRVTGSFEGLTKSARVSAPGQGQARVVMRFPEVAGDE